MPGFSLKVGTEQGLFGTHRRWSNHNALRLPTALAANERAVPAGSTGYQVLSTEYEVLAMGLVPAPDRLGTAIMKRYFLWKAS
jgi:hypothetical protein